MSAEHQEFRQNFCRDMVSERCWTESKFGKLFGTLLFGQPFWLAERERDPFSLTEGVARLVPLEGN